MKVLITGGAGYIGSTICSALEDNGHTPIILDSLVRGRSEFTKDRLFYKADIAEKEVIHKIFTEHPDIACTIHCAAYIIVPESVANPYEYYKENVAKSNEFFKTLVECGQKHIIFSSSASIYDIAPNFQVTESSPVNPGSPYARTKLMMEMLLEDFAAAYGLQAIILRYFNPIGADPKMRSGIHVKKPSHVLGKLVDASLGKIPYFELTGVEWPTRDGSGIRDYIHVWDLAMAHLRAAEKFTEVFTKKCEKPNFRVINIGTGSGVTVKELVRAFENVYGKPVPQKVSPARLGDVAGAYANCNLAVEFLGWKAELSLEQAIADALKWGKLRGNILHGLNEGE